MSEDNFNYKKELDSLINAVKRQEKKKILFEEPDPEILEKVKDSDEAYDKQLYDEENKRMSMNIDMFLLEYNDYDYKKVFDHFPFEEQKSQKDQNIELTIPEDRFYYYKKINNVIIGEDIPLELVSKDIEKRPPLLFIKGNTSVLSKNKEVKLLTLSFEKEDDKVGKKLKDDLNEFFINCKLNETTVIISSNEKYSELALKIATKYSVKVINILPYGVDHIRDYENEFNILNISPFLNDKKRDFTTIEVARQYKNEIKNNVGEQVFEDIDPKYKKKKKSVER